MVGGVTSRNGGRRRLARAGVAALRDEISGAGRLVPVLALIVVFCLLDRLLMRVTRLPSDSYYEAVLIVEFFKHLPQAGWQAMLAALPFIVVAPFCRRLPHYSWNEFQNGRSLRIIISAVSFLLAWSMSTVDHNLYFNQAYSLDRALVLIFFALIIWRPFYVLPFLIATIPLLGQGNLPLTGSSLTMPLLPLRILILFAATLLLACLIRCQKTTPFTFAVLCMVAAHYWPSGFGKLTREWIFHDQVGFLLPATYANGWLGFLEPATIESLTQLLLRINVPIKIFTIVIECGAIFALWRRSVFMAFLAGCIALHIGILLVTGICFWPWIAIEATLLVILAWNREFAGADIFTRWHFAASILLVASASIWLRPVALCWLDVNATYTYRIEATGQSGKKYWLPPLWFAPYDNQFTLGSFGYISRMPTLSIAWGVTADSAVAKRLEEAQSPEQILVAELELGHERFDAEATSTFAQFLRRFLDNYNKRQSRNTWLSWFRAPPQLWTFAPTDAFSGQELLSKVTVYQVLSCYCQGKYAEIRIIPVLAVNVMRAADDDAE